MVRSSQAANTIFPPLGRWFTVFASVCVATLLLAAIPCSAETEALADTNGRHALVGHVPLAVASSRRLYELPGATILHLAIGLPLRNQDKLDSLLAQISDPQSPNYRHYLSAAEFAAQFGPTEQDYQAAIQFAQENGLVVTGTHSNRVLLDVSGGVTAIENAFHVRMMNYSHPVRGEFYAPDREPTMSYGSTILDISGLDNFNPPHPMDIKKSVVSEARTYVTGSGPGGYFIGKDFRAAYAPGVTLTGSGQVVGLLEFDGFYAADVQKNAAQAGVSVVPTQTVLLNGFNGVPGSQNIEVTLDIMMASYMAPGLSKVIVYEGSNPNDILNRMATDNQAQQLSSSWGFGPINSTTEQIFKQFIAQGQSLLQASGDSGAYKTGVMQPSDDPNLTVVGGTSLTTSGMDGPWQSESTWSGSGGGISTSYSIPSYQQGINMAANGGSTKMRNIPDVALTADVQMYLIQSNGQAVAVGGTSAATPLWAGFVALANQQAAANAKARVGFLNPPVYGIGNSSKFGSDFNDITRGGNNGFSAATGYDLTTGWGSPTGQHLIDDLTGTSGTQAFGLTPSAAAIAIVPSSTGTDAITVTAVNGFNGSVTLGITGLPIGVSAAFSQLKTTGSSIITFTANASAVSGTYPLTVNGTSGTLSSKTTIALSVVVPNFTLSASAASLTIPQSKSASSTITIGSQNGFSGSVSLKATGLPSGVTAVFSAASTTTTSSLTLTASSTATPGSYSIVVTGVSGALKNATTIALTISAPTFNLAFVPGNLGLTRGSTAAGTLTITSQTDFKGNITLAAASLPAGVTASFGAMSTTGNIQVMFTASTTATAGSFSSTIVGVSGALKSSIPFTVTVLAAPAGASLVNLSSAYNVSALVSNGVSFTGGGLDGGLNGSSTAYSADLVGVQQSIVGMLFSFGPANAPDAVTSKSISLPPGKYSKLMLLATGANGNQLSQRFTVTYIDGTVSSFTQNLSDWFAPQSFVGEVKAMTMPYRNNARGQQDNRTFYMYEYTFTLNSSKTVSSVTLPNNRNVVVLSASLTSATSATRLNLRRY